jgi:hypothetical protein
MMRTVKLVAVVAMALFLVGPASAIDMCFQVHTYLFVMKSYKRPSKGKCRPLTGYEASTAVPHPATGTACLNATGDTLYVHWNAMLEESGSSVHLTSRTQLPYPSSSGGVTHFCTLRSPPFGNSCGNTAGPQSAFACQPAPLP